MDQVVTLTPDVAAWLADLVARQTNSPERMTPHD